jgi:hypothetical protein
MALANPRVQWTAENGWGAFLNSMAGKPQEYFDHTPLLVFWQAL